MEASRCSQPSRSQGRCSPRRVASQPMRMGLALLVLAVAAQAQQMPAPHADTGGWPNRTPAAPITTTGPWQQARATFAYNNDGMDINGGSCGYTDVTKLGHGLNVAAITDVNPDYVGSCGRCYEFRCRNAVFKDNYGNQIDRSNACIDTSKTVVMTIVDTCPCNYPSNAYSNKRWCCGDMTHFDTSYWAAEQLADPKLGVFGIDYREVPCNAQPNNSSSNATTTAPPAPGAPSAPAGSQGSSPPAPSYASQGSSGGITPIYQGGFQGGWWQTSSSANTDPNNKSGGLSGGAGLCSTLHGGGALQLGGPAGSFSQRMSLSFYIKPTSGSSTPNVNVQLLSQAKGCSSVPLSSLGQSTGGQNGFLKYDIYLGNFLGSSNGEVSAFAAAFKGCGGATADQINQIKFINPGGGDIGFCLDEVELLG